MLSPIDLCPAYMLILLFSPWSSISKALYDNTYISEAITTDKIVGFNNVDDGGVGMGRLTQIQGLVSGEDHNSKRSAFWLSALWKDIVSSLQLCITGVCMGA